MNINCINEKIVNSKTALKPIILQAILDLFKEGKMVMTLKMVRQRCILLDSKFPKNSHQEKTEILMISLLLLIVMVII